MQLQMQWMPPALHTAGEKLLLGGCVPGDGGGHASPHGGAGSSGQHHGEELG
jgi:hypothetical protein